MSSGTKQFGAISDTATDAEILLVRVLTGHLVVPHQHFQLAKITCSPKMAAAS